MHSRHFTPEYRAWDPAEATCAIAEIVADALDRLHPETLWPSHPADDGVPDGHGSIYFGAAGVLWALNRLRQMGVVADVGDLAPPLAVAQHRNVDWFAGGPYPQHASLSFGDLGILLARMRVTPQAELVDQIYACAARNNVLPTVELMWGLPGSMLACVLMRDLAVDSRFEDLFRTQAARLLSELEETADGPIWNQDLYGQRRRLLSAVHGFAGNGSALLAGWDWLDDSQRSTITGALARTVAATAVRSDAGVNWPASLPPSEAPVLCQHCHGAPGIVTALADAPFSIPTFDRSLRDGGEFIWQAGPLTKGASLCHGTSGNGYAFLKLHRRTGDPVWLERARAFAMVAIDQVRESRAALGRGRYSLWTGDIGTALFLHGCVTDDPAFPTIDVL